MANDPKASDIAAPMIDMMKRMQETGFSQMSGAQIPGMGTQWMETMSAIGSQILAFMSERVQQDVQTQHDLLNAKGIAEVQRIQAEFVQKATNDYVDEMAKLIELGKTLVPQPSINPKAPKP
ncbi:MAG: phasin family protein [Paracoccaceae bacterium]